MPFSKFSRVLATFKTRTEQEQFHAINKELETHIEKLKKSLYPHIANLQVIRRRLQNQPVAGSTATHLHEAGITLLYNVFDLYELAPTDLTYLENRFASCVDAYREKFEWLPLPNTHLKPTVK